MTGSLVSVPFCSLRFTLRWPSKDPSYSIHSAQRWLYSSSPSRRYRLTLTGAGPFIQFRRLTPSTIAKESARPTHFLVATLAVGFNSLQVHSQIKLNSCAMYRLLRVVRMDELYDNSK